MSDVVQANKMTPEFEGMYYNPKWQWFCAHMNLVDETGKEWSVYFWPAQSQIDDAWILSFHTSEGEMLNFTEVHLPVGTIKAGRTGAEVSYGNQFFRGSFPRYHAGIGGYANGKSYFLDVVIEAETDAFEAVPNLRGIDWNYIPRMKAAGTLRVDDKLLAVKGYSYLERRRGRFWTPGVARGIWESAPLASKDGLSIPIFYKVFKNDGSAQLQTLTFTADGKTPIEYANIDVEILETTKFPGFEHVDHPTRYTISATGDRGKAELEIVRAPNRLMMNNYLGEPSVKANATGIYGTGRMKGRLDVDGRVYDIDGDSYGSALFFSEKP